MSPTPALDLVLITGISGSGKSIALHALEDVGYYCVDNLPPELLAAFADLQLGQGARKVAVAVDVRSAAALPLVPQALDALAAKGVAVKLVFLDANTPTLVQRFSETRRRHPLSASAAPTATTEPVDTRALTDAIELERHTLSDLRDRARVIDTSNIRPAVLQTWLKELVAAPRSSMSLVFESFAFKNGVPLNADFVFDVRSLPNPHYTLALRPLTGRDQPVVDYLAAQPEVVAMVADIRQFLQRWLPSFARDHRSYVTVAIGCTGGQHRSVYIATRLAAELGAELKDTLGPGQAPVVRHRELK
jgi:UPF0042 nucleotide-binding protein